MMDFTEKRSRRNRVYTGRAVHFSADEIILPDGKRSIREYMEHPGAVAVLPFTDDGKLVMVKQYRYPVGRVTCELPAGKLDKGEKPSFCVKRELREETGFSAGRIGKLLSYWPTSAFSNEIIHVYWAGDLKPVKKSPDEDEFIDHLVVPFQRALEWVEKGKIRDSKTVIGILYWALYKRKM